MGLEAIGKRCKVDGVWAHLVADVIQAHLPADQVLDVLNDKMRLVNMGRRVGSWRREAIVGAPDGHGIRGVVVCCTGRHHVEEHGWVLDRLRGEMAETENRGSRQGSRQHDCRENYSTPSLHLVTHPRLRIEAVRLLRAQLRLKSNGITMGRQSQPIA